MTKYWDFLKKGDIVDIIAPASSAPGEKLPQGIESLKKWGLIPRVPEGMITPSNFFAAPLKIQLDQFKSAIHAEDSKAIWCLRGGYGSMRLIPYLEKMKPPKRPKLFIGFSDITSLHLYLNQKWNWPTIHGRTISQMEPDKLTTPDRILLHNVIFGRKKSITFDHLVPLNDLARERKEIEGKIIGGNLRILQTSLKTSWEIKAKGKILFIEDINERGYSVHRLLEQLHQAKIIDKGLKALVIGDFSDGLEKDGRDLVPVALEEFAHRLPYPVVKGIPSGHDKEINYPLPFYTTSVLKLGPHGHLKCNINGF
jgi:muramoyltetrapeptide carboxypeptidase